MNIDAVRGSKVKFTGENVGNYQEAEAKKVLTVGEIYEIDAIITSSFFNYVKLKGYKEKFRSEMFEDV